MEIMELPVQIRTILTIMFTLFITNCTIAQHQIDKDVTFSQKGEKSFVKLNPFLANFRIDYQNLENCANSSGVVKFQVTPKGKIASIDVEGNLPSVLIDSVKVRILLIKSKWVFSDAILEKKKNIVFYYPLYIQQSEKCNYKIHESYNLLKRFFENEKVVRIKDEIYYIEPIVWYATIK